MYLTALQVLGCLPVNALYENISQLCIWQNLQHLMDTAEHLSIQTAEHCAALKYMSVLKGIRTRERRIGQFLIVRVVNCMISVMKLSAQ